MDCYLQVFEEGMVLNKITYKGCEILKIIWPKVNLCHLGISNQYVPRTRSQENMFQKPNKKKQ